MKMSLKSLIIFQNASHYSKKSHITHYVVAPIRKVSTFLLITFCYFSFAVYIWLLFCETACQVTAFQHQNTIFKLLFFLKTLIFNFKQRLYTINHKQIHCFLIIFYVSVKTYLEDKLFIKKRFLNVQIWTKARN
jgi:hypothetical protein